MKKQVRPANLRDAEAAVYVVRRSIVELCGSDHVYDPKTLAEWLSNKTAEDFLCLLQSKRHLLVVAESDSVICGVGLIGNDGEIQLCYVLPGMQRRGIGTALLQRLESQARAWGLKRLHLRSTGTACGFYERHDYLSDGEAAASYGIAHAYPYAKTLAARH